MLSLNAPYPFFSDIDGAPLDGGFIYIGEVNQNPETAPVSVFWDEALTQPAAQPLRTSNGYIVRTGTPARVYVSGDDFSMTAKRANGVVIFYERSVAAASTLRDDLADTTDAAKGSGMVGFNAALNYVVGTIGYSLKTKGLTVKDFGAVGDGVTDDSVAIRLAFDNMAAGSAASVGGQTFFLPGIYYCPSVVYIPRSNGPQKIYGAGATLKGSAAGAGTIFETGEGTVSTGGVSNFGTNELYLHYNTVVEGLQFTNCEFALKLNNFLQGCVVRNCGATVGVKTLVYGRRCFYMNVLNNSVLTSYDSAVTADTEACFRFEDNNNGMVVQGNSALRSAITKGAGYYFSAGTSGVVFSGNTAERCAKGLVILGAVYGMTVTGNFLEGNGIDLSIQDANYKRGLEVDCNWFYSAIAVQAVSWFSGSLGANNHYEGAGAVTINNSLGADGSINSLHVWLPRQVVDESTARATPVVPANWLLNGSIVVHRQSSVYLAATGPSAPRALLTETSLGPTMIAAHNFVGDPGLKRFYATDGGLPYCTVVNNTNPGPGTIVITTQIAWDTYATGARFDLVVLDSFNTFRMCGWVSGTTVFRDDALVQTCVASIVGGKLVLTIGNFTLGDVAGGVRIM